MPLHQTAAEGLHNYLRQRRRLHSDNEYVFVDEDARTLKYTAVYWVFQKLLKLAAIGKTDSGHAPRLHELRHSFAVRALEASPEGRDRVGQHMLALATYLGHVNIYSTYWYLQATPELVRDIAVSAEHFFIGERT